MQCAFVSSAQSNTTTSITYSYAGWNGNIFAAFKLNSPTAGLPVATVNPAFLSFGNQAVGTTSAPKAVTLSNIGNAALTIQDILATPGFAETNNCGSSLAAGSSCTISVTFTPTWVANYNGELRVTDNSGGSSSQNQSVSLTGNGVIAGGGGPAVVQVQNNIDVSGAAFTSFSVPITTNPGDLLVAFVRESSNGTDNFTVADSAGQTWLPITQYVNESSTGPRIGMFYMANSAAVSSVAVHYTTSGGVVKPGIMVMEISGAVGIGTQVSDGVRSSASGASTTTSQSGPLFTSNASDILIFATDTAANQVPNANTSGGWMAGPGYAIPNNKLTIGASGSNVRMAMQYAVVSSIQSGAKASMTYPNSAWNGNIFAAFE